MTFAACIIPYLLVAIIFGFINHSLLNERLESDRNDARVPLWMAIISIAIVWPLMVVYVIAYSIRYLITEWRQ